MRHSPKYHGAYKEYKKYKQSNKIKIDKSYEASWMLH